MLPSSLRPPVTAFLSQEILLVASRMGNFIPLFLGILTPLSTAALAIGKLIERRTGMSIKRFVNTVRPIRSGTVIINGKEYTAEADVPLKAIPLIRKLQTGH